MGFEKRGLAKREIWLNMPFFTACGMNVNVNNIAAFLKVCYGVGIGSALFKAGKSIEEVPSDARTIVAVAKKRPEALNQLPQIWSFGILSNGRNAAAKKHNIY